MRTSIDLNQRRLLTTDEAAEALGLSTRHLANLRKTGLAAVKVGRAVRFDTDDLLAWIAQNRRLPEPTMN
jgi:excisionase family DNA binding protein